MVCDMEIIKLSAIAIISAVLCIYLKKYREEYSMLVSLAAGAVIFGAALPYFRDFVIMVQAFADTGGISAEYLKPMIKVVGISYITAYSCELCRDAKEGALAAKLEMAGKLILLGISIPVITSLFETVVKLI